VAKSKKISKLGKSKQAKAKKAPVTAKKMKKSASKATAKKKVVKAKPKPKAKAKPIAKPKIAVKPVQKLQSKTLAKKMPPVDYSKVVTPLGDRLVVRIVTQERMTAGGLYIPDTVSDVQGHLKGEVLAAGTGVRNKKGHKRPLDVAVGDQIYFEQYSTTKVNFGSEELHIVKEVDVLGVAK
jgi:chaperonin GroES